MNEKEEQYRKINDEYNNFSYMFYEHMRKKYTKKDVDNQIDKLITNLNQFKNIQGGTKD